MTYFCIFVSDNASVIVMYIFMFNPPLSLCNWMCVGGSVGVLIHIHIYKGFDIFSLMFMYFSDLAAL